MSAYREHVAEALKLAPSAVAVSLISCPLSISASIRPYAPEELDKEK